MADVLNREANKALEEEVWVAISAFEQILEAMPSDRAFLEALSHAYGQIGDHAREKEYIIRLGNVLVEEGDREGAVQVLENLKPHLAEDPRAQALAERIEMIASAGGGRASVAGAGALPDIRNTRSGFSMADELSFAWNLLQANQMTEPEYASVVHDLAEMSASDALATISVLHALEFRTSKNLDRIMGFVAKDCGTPIVNLASFGFPSEAMALLPTEFMVPRGVLVFEFIGQDALVAIMNPYNRQLRGEVEAMTGRKCHFYLALPSDFDQAVTRVRNLMTEKTDAQKEA